MTNGVFKPSKPGTVFKEETGKLYVFTSGSITVLKGWPPEAWKKTRSNPNWVRFRPEIAVPCRDIDARIRQFEHPEEEGGQLLLPLDALLRPRELAWLKWYATIPQEARELARRLPTRQWHLLSFLARCGKAAFDLSASNPALAYALASNWVFHRPAVQRPLRSVRALLGPGKRQREACAWLGFPETEASRKTLNKVVHKAINVSGLLYLRQSMADADAQKALSHLQRLNAGAIRIITDPGLFPLATPRLLQEVAHCREEDSRPKAAYLLRDSAAMQRLLFGGSLNFAPVGHINELAATHDSLIEDLNRAECLDRDIAFPSPPVKGSEFIVPVTSARELVKEGREQHNCVASYMKRVALQQRVFIYRVLWPERCTLSVSRHGDRWVLSELMRACNEQPSPKTREVVAEWFRQETGLTDEKPDSAEPWDAEVDDLPF